MTFSEMLLECYDECNFKSTPNADIVSRFKRWINRGHTIVLSDPSRTKLRDKKGLSFSTEVDRKTYAMPLVFEQISRLYTLTNPRVLSLSSDDDIARMDPAEISTGTPYTRVDYGLSPFYRLPDSTGLWAVSSEAADTQVIYLTGIRANGDQTTQIATTLNGLTRVQISGFTDFVDVLTVALQSAAAGTVTIYDAAVSGNDLTRILPGATSSMWHINRLWPTPASVESIYVDGKAAVMPLIQPNDVPLLPISYHDLPVLYAQMRHWKKQGDRKRYDVTQAEWATRLGKLNASLDYPADWQAHTGDLDTGVRWNNLGGEFPADGHGS